MNKQDFMNLIRSMLSVDTDGEAVRLIEVMPGKMVAFKDEMITKANRDKFVEKIATIKHIHKGISYKDIATGLDIENNQAIVIQAVGKAFGLWTLVPVDLESKEMQQVMMKSDTTNMMPMNSGLNVRGVIPPNKGVSVEANVDIGEKK